MRCQTHGRKKKGWDRSYSVWWSETANNSCCVCFPPMFLCSSFHPLWWNHLFVFQISPETSQLLTNQHLTDVGIYLQELRTVCILEISTKACHCFGLILIFHCLRAETDAEYMHRFDYRIHEWNLKCKCCGFRERYLSINKTNGYIWKTIIVQILHVKQIICICV